MARQPAPGTRERILNTAARLFYEHGVQAVGLQRIIDECGCGKNLLYREFPSKDELVAAYLAKCGDTWAESVEQATAPLDGDPSGQIIAIVRAVAEQIYEPEFRGCSFQNALAEFADPNHPIRDLSVAHLSGLHTHLESLSEQAGVIDPSALADRILFIIQGLLATAAVQRHAELGASAVGFAHEVVNDAPKRPARQRGQTRDKRPIRDRQTAARNPRR
jgi:AcrR family transcriptional regulator